MLWLRIRGVGSIAARELYVLQFDKVDYRETVGEQRCWASVSQHLRGAGQPWSDGEPWRCDERDHCATPNELHVTEDTDAAGTHLRRISFCYEMLALRVHWRGGNEEHRYNTKGRRNEKVGCTLYVCPPQKTKTSNNRHN